MVKEILAAGGQGTLIPIAFAGAVMTIVKWFQGLEHRRSERRRQFLELWPQRKEGDALWSQVALCHLTGEYLPQVIVDIALAQPDKASTLVELAHVWDYLALTETSPPRLDWRRRIYRQAGGRRLVRWAFNIGYFVFAWVAGWLLLAVVGRPISALAWMWGVFGGLTGFMAIMFLVHDYRLQEASKLAPRWIVRINALLGGQMALLVQAPVTAALPTGLPQATVTDVQHGPADDRTVQRGVQESGIGVNMRR